MTEKEATVQQAKQSVDIAQAKAAAARYATDVMKLLEVAQKEGLNNNFGAITGYYQQIIALNPDSWVAELFSVLINAFPVNTGDVANACNAVESYIKKALDTIDTQPDFEKKWDVTILSGAAVQFSDVASCMAINTHLAIPVSQMSAHNGALKAQMVSALNILITCASQIMSRYGDNDEIASCVENPARRAVEFYKRQSFVTIALSAETNATLLNWIGRFNPTFVEDYKKKQNRSMTTGNVFLMILGAIFLAIGLMTEGTFAKWFCIPMAAFCLLWGLFRIIVQVANKKLNG